MIKFMSAKFQKKIQAILYLQCKEQGASSVDPDEAAHFIWNHTVCKSTTCIFILGTIDVDIFVVKMVPGFKLLAHT